MATVSGISVREAQRGEVAAVLNVLDGADLAIEYESIEDRIEDGSVLIATREQEGDADGDGVILGVLVLDGNRTVAIAVRRRQRDQGIGTALVEAAATRRNGLVAEFDDSVRPFWASLGFEIVPLEEDGRFRGYR